MFAAAKVSLCQRPGCETKLCMILITDGTLKGFKMDFSNENPFIILSQLCAKEVKKHQSETFTWPRYMEHSYSIKFRKKYITALFMLKIEETNNFNLRTQINLKSPTHTVEHFQRKLKQVIFFLFLTLQSIVLWEGSRPSKLLLFFRHIQIWYIYTNYVNY